MAKTRRLQQTLLYVVLILGAFVMMIPFLYTLSTSLKENIFVFEPSFIPENPTLENFNVAWNSNNFKLYFLNSLKVSIISTVLTVAVAATQAYAFARMTFPGKNIVFNF